MANVNPQPGPQPGPQLGPQPDFARLAQGLQQATTELGNFANLPAFAQGNALIQQMQQMQKQIQQVQQQMQQQLQQTSTAIRGDIQALRNDISTNNQATEYNSIARLQNAAARRPDHPLTALRDLTTNMDIPGFPATPTQLAHMTGAMLDPILTALDLPTTDTVAERQQRLKFHIGLWEML